MSSISDYAILGKYFEAFRPRLEQFFERQLGSQMTRVVEASDIVQNVAIKAQESLSRDKSRRAAVSNYGWWYRMAKDCLYDEIRRQMAKKRGAAVTQCTPSRSALRRRARIPAGWLASTSRWNRTPLALKDTRTMASSRLSSRR